MAIKERASGEQVERKQAAHDPAEPSHITLSEQDSTLFTKALENPPEPNAHLVQAMREFDGKA